MTSTTCHVCGRTIQTINAVQAKRSGDTRIVRQPTFAYHHDDSQTECRGSRRPVTQVRERHDSRAA